MNGLSSLLIALFWLPSWGSLLSSLLSSLSWALSLKLSLELSFELYFDCPLLIALLSGRSLKLSLKSSLELHLWIRDAFNKKNCWFGDIESKCVSGLGWKHTFRIIRNSDINVVCKWVDVSLSLLNRWYYRAIVALKWKWWNGIWWYFNNLSHKRVKNDV